MALEGTLHDMPLTDLFEIFRMGSKSGILRIADSTQHSSIYVTMGRLIDAAIYDASTRQLIARGDDAILQLLQWKTAEFAFTHDPLTIRHPVTIFHAIDDLIRFNAEVPRLTPQVARPPHMVMPISANQAFMHDLDPLASSADRQDGRRAPHLFVPSSASDAASSAEPSTSQSYHIDLPSSADRAQYDALAIPVTPRLSAGLNGQEAAAEQALPAVQAPRAVVPNAGRKLLAAVLRRVRAL